MGQVMTTPPTEKAPMRRRPSTAFLITLLAIAIALGGLFARATMSDS